jgi:hypothetical protein
MILNWRRTQQSSETAHVGDYLLRVSALPVVSGPHAAVWSIRHPVARGRGTYDNVIGHGTADSQNEARRAAEEELARLVSAHELLDLLAEHGEEPGR